MKNIKESFKILVAVLALAVIILPGCGGGKSLDKVLAPTDALSDLTWSETERTTRTDAEIGTEMDYIYSTVDDNGTAANLTSANTYVGKTQCQGCHSEIYGTFIQTNHSTAMDRKAANVLDPSDHFSGSCIYCHSVDGPRVPTYADDMGTSPNRSDLTKGAWGLAATDYSGLNTDAAVINFVATSALAGIQCENCHGPGSAHVVSQSKSDIIRGSQARNVSVCAVCHDAPTHHVKVANWRKTAHSASLDGTHMGGSNSCAPCHAADGFINLLERQDGLQDEAVPWDGLTRKDDANGDPTVSFSASPSITNVNCAACHDPHARQNGEHQLRRDPANLCVTCHSGRNKIADESNWRGPHHNIQAKVIGGYGIVNPDGKMLWTQDGYLCNDSAGVARAKTSISDCDTTAPYMETVATPIGPVMGSTSCYQCHMYEGSHTFAPSAEACQVCHTNMNVESVVGSMQAEWTEMHDKLSARFAKMKTDAVLVSNKPTTFGANTAAKYKAYFYIDWNIKFMEYDGAKGFHNMDLERLAYQYTDEMLTEYGY